MKDKSDVVPIDALASRRTDRIGVAYSWQIQV